jgi:hypothetical protein
LVLGIHPVNGIALPRFIFIVMAAPFGLFGFIAFHSFRASLKPSNWLLRCNNSGVIIHFRSFLNWRFPAEDVQAVGFDYSEIASVRTVKERRNSPSLGNSSRTQTELLTFVDFCLAGVDTAALEKRLQEEGAISPEGVMISRDYPVQVKPGGIIELRWRSISPSARKAIKYLGQHVKIAEPDSRTSNLTHQINLPPGAEDGKILELAKSGDEMGAIELTQQAYGCSLREAKDRLAKLRSAAR